MKKYEKEKTIGIPRALLYYKYGKLWTGFFDALNIKYMVSPKTNKKILKKGIKLTNDETCLSLKIYIGHVDYLKNKTDLILIPRIGRLKKNEVVCTNFNALYDLTNNIFNTKFLDFNIDLRTNELYEFIKIGRYFGKNRLETIKAYKNAKMNLKEKIKTEQTSNSIKLNNKKKKVLIVGHPYNLEDEFIGKEVIKFIENENIEVIKTTMPQNIKKYKKIMPTMYFSFNKEIVSSMLEYIDKVEGIILISTFPCGSDSLINEMILRNIKDKLIINILFDELIGNAGLHTRLESFIDIIKKEI